MRSLVFGKTTGILNEWVFKLASATDATESFHSKSYNLVNKFYRLLVDHCFLPELPFFPLEHYTKLCPNLKANEGALKTATPSECVYEPAHLFTDWMMASNSLPQMYSVKLIFFMSVSGLLSSIFKFPSSRSCCLISFFLRGPNLFNKTTPNMQI